MLFNLSNRGPVIKIEDFNDIFLYNKFVYNNGKLFDGPCHETTENYIFYYNLKNGRFHSTIEKPSFVCVSSYEPRSILYVHWCFHGKKIKSYSFDDERLDFFDPVGWAEFILESIKY